MYTVYTYTFYLYMYHSNFGTITAPSVAQWQKNYTRLISSIFFYYYISSSFEYINIIQFHGIKEEIEFELVGSLFCGKYNNKVDFKLNNVIKATIFLKVYMRVWGGCLFDFIWNKKNCFFAFVLKLFLDFYFYSNI